MPGGLATAARDGFGAAWGRAVARYYAGVLRPECVHVVGRRPDTPTIWASWHEANLLGLVAYRGQNHARPCHSFVPPGWDGAVARGWVAEAGMVAAPIADRLGTGGVAALRRLSKALDAGHDVAVAVDAGGPAGHVHAGALWLARATGCPLVPVGAAVAPAFRLRRWDRLLVPLPGAHAQFVYGSPICLPPRARLDEALRAATAEALNAATGEAWRLLRVRSGQTRAVADG